MEKLPLVVEQYLYYGIFYRIQQLDSYISMNMNRTAVENLHSEIEEVIDFCEKNSLFPTKSTRKELEQIWQRYVELVKSETETP
ncbi:hypothetical protein [Aneurinibacillus terranovensis]|uniref:hypothetical protein n=1 Tax=Aneurinibacillus terranovensis TaxID=278991 RepID=UPI00048445CC|nr:hypothetical protein [Aneurinibacillus terranovensis]